MKFIKPNAATPLPRGSGVGRPSMPEWRREWLANLPRFVEMECGHGEDISVQTIVVKEFGGDRLQVFCLPCDALKVVVKRVTVAERLGITVAEIPDEPLF